MLLVEKHVVCLALMDAWLLPALFLSSHTVHVTVFDPFIIRQVITPSY